MAQMSLWGYIISKIRAYGGFNRNLLHFIIKSDKAEGNVRKYSSILRKVVRKMKVKEFMTKLMVRFQSRKGQGMVEYGLIIGIIAVILIASLTVLREPLEELFGRIGAIITDNTPSAPVATP